MCVAYRRRDGEGRVLGCREGDITCGGLERKLELVVWAVW